MVDRWQEMKHRPIGHDVDGRPFDCAVCGFAWPCPYELTARTAVTPEVKEILRAAN